MSAAEKPTPRAPSRPADTDAGEGDNLSRRSQVGASVIVMALSGKVDATNAEELLGSQRFRRYLRPGRALVLDMTKVNFLGVQGLCHLLDLKRQCHSAGVTWSVATSHSVLRMLRVGDCHHSLPTAGTVLEALQGLDLDNPTADNRLLQIVVDRRSR
ncbi:MULTISPECIES: STAS domain-containing protein [unclassified Mycobacterium]|uniref:STAS domain-containing protein n=1 Tax=Mycobacterium TaxID=1763 RepID=UPI0027407AB0|nr:MULTISPECIES: STAS domain-containing protein [unclassified Mycobacterium]MDP7707529.1 STAS domain-containing protein [Mycobacterium sp. TY815]MDP7733091.1 STAS domain-containing protein [Mycobacterium sp. TY813]